MDFSNLYPTASVPSSKADLCKRSEIKNEIRRRAEWLSNDCSTFWRVRLEHTSWYKKGALDATIPRVGGGNFVMALAMFSVCNFLAKANSFLKNPDTLVTQEDRDTVKQAKATIKKSCPEIAAVFKNNKTDWVPPKVGSCNETDAFARLVAALYADGIELGLPPADAKAVWNRFRNKLAHMAHPDGIVEVLASDQPLADARSAMHSTTPAFRRAGGQWICNADKLSIDVLRISEWLCGEVDSCSDHDRIGRLAHWMFDDMDVLPVHHAEQ